MYFIQINQNENLSCYVYLSDAGNRSQHSISLPCCLSSLHRINKKILILYLLVLSMFRGPTQANCCAVVDQRQTEPQMQKTEVKEHLGHAELWGKRSVTAL